MENNGDGVTEDGRSEKKNVRRERGRMMGRKEKKVVVRRGG